MVSDEVGGHPLKWLNYVLVDSSGALWCSVSTAADDLLDTVARGTADGYIFRVAPDRSSAAVVASDIQFPNCMALDRDEGYLYVARTLAADAVRFPIVGESLGEQEQFGPALGRDGPTNSGPTRRRYSATPKPVGGGEWPTVARSMRRETSGSH